MSAEDLNPHDSTSECILGNTVESVSANNEVLNPKLEAVQHRHTHGHTDAAYAMHHSRFMAKIEPLTTVGQQILEAYCRNPSLRLSPWVLQKQYGNPNHLVTHTCKNGGKMGWDLYCYWMQTEIIDKLTASNETRFDLKAHFTIKIDDDRSHSNIIKDIEASIADVLNQSRSDSVSIQSCVKGALYHAVIDNYKHPISLTVDWEYIRNVIVERHPEWKNQLTYHRSGVESKYAVKMPDFDNEKIAFAYDKFMTHYATFSKVGEALIDYMIKNPLATINSQTLLKLGNPNQVVTNYFKNSERSHWELYAYFMQTEILNKMPPRQDAYYVNLIDRLRVTKHESYTPEIILNKLESQITNALAKREELVPIKLPIEHKGKLYDAVKYYFREPETHFVDWEGVVDQLIQRNPDFKDQIYAINRPSPNWGSPSMQEKLLDYYSDKLLGTLERLQPEYFYPSWMEEHCHSVYKHIQNHHNSQWKDKLINRLPEEWQTAWHYHWNYKQPILQNNYADNLDPHELSPTDRERYHIELAQQKLEHAHPIASAFLKDIPNECLPIYFQQAIRLHEHLAKYVNHGPIPMGVVGHINYSLLQVQQNPIMLAVTSPHPEYGKKMEAHAIGAPIGMQEGIEGYFNTMLDRLAFTLPQRSQPYHLHAAQFEFASMLLQNALIYDLDGAVHHYSPNKPTPEAPPLNERRADAPYIGFGAKLRHYVDEILNIDIVKQQLAIDEYTPITIELLTTIDVKTLDYKASTDAVIRCAIDNDVHYIRLDFTVAELFTKHHSRAHVIKPSKGTDWEASCARQAGIIASHLIRDISLKTGEVHEDDAYMLAKVIQEHLSELTPSFDETGYSDVVGNILLDG